MSRENWARIAGALDGSTRIAELEAEVAELEAFVATHDLVQLREQRDDLLTELTEAQAEIARHHRDFERWEEMANRGAEQIRLARIGLWVEQCEIGHHPDEGWMMVTVTHPGGFDWSGFESGPAVADFVRAALSAAESTAIEPADGATG